jgi:tocopherol O-methyltransferase
LAVITPRTPPSRRRVAHHYDELDPLYRRLWGEHLHHGLWRSGFEPPELATLQLLDEVVERAALRPGMAVCDVGAGYGATARYLAARLGAEVTAVTLSSAQVAYARVQPPAPGAPPPRYLLRDWLDNGLPDAVFDAVLALESTEHMPLEGCLSEVYRVLQPGGRFVACVWLAREGARGLEVRTLLEPICREGRLVGLCSAREYGEALRRAGFAVERADDVSLLVRRTWGVVLRRLAWGLLTRRELWAYLLSSRHLERPFGWTVLRLWLAYRTGALRYGIFSAVRR